MTTELQKVIHIYSLMLSCILYFYFKKGQPPDYFIKRYLEQEGKNVTIQYKLKEIISPILEFTVDQVDLL